MNMETNVVNKKKERSSNFELLRIFAILAIILGHFIGQSGCYDILSGTNLLIATFLGSAHRIAVSVFLIMGIWFMVDAKFKASRVLNLYGQLIFYTVSIFTILKIYHVHISLFKTIRTFFPFFSFALWFVSAYIILILLSPFLNKILELERTILKKFLIILFIFIPLLSTMWIHMDTKLCVIFYFMYAYLYVGYFKKYLYQKFKLNKYIGLIIAGLIYITFVLLKYYFLQTHNLGILYKIITNYLGDYKSIPNLLISLPVFYFFLNLKIGSNKIINFISKSVLATYIIHQTPCFIVFLWHNIYKCDIYLNSSQPVLYILFVAISLYIACILIDCVRRAFIEPLWTNSKLYKLIENKMNSFYADIQSISGEGKPL